MSSKYASILSPTGKKKVRNKDKGATSEGPGAQIGKPPLLQPKQEQPARTQKSGRVITIK